MLPPLLLELAPPLELPPLLEPEFTPPLELDAPPLLDPELLAPPSLLSMGATEPPHPPAAAASPVTIRAAVPAGMPATQVMLHSLGFRP